ncbi:MAG TPA: SDR family oxidoreductase [Rectinema sp.]|jgi:NAD(P)-dependent dehydrogenase (short-subunit alcohol dehydrogenase family)|nr:hypothetical protein [Spirochaetaceae bacterium]HOM92933.1 SDR family oxidoreductase [Rectinema sp.]HOU06945.1 SDR family oxidoreductase [Rectinema sp.]HOW12100.1 SDR family oxidoreductase [Rectinema sp.]HPG95838.1 SDR family oxidoreductase [Rectinema sp.]
MSNQNPEDIQGHLQIQNRTSTLSGKLALIVGGSGGIGLAISNELASRGAALLIQGRHASDKLQENSFPKAKSLGLIDLEFSNPAQFIQALDLRLEDIASEPDIVVCAFGPFLEKPLKACTTKDWEWLTLADLALPGALTSRFLPGMMERKYGRFIFFGGTRTDTVRSYKKTAAYASAKTGLGVLAKSIAVEGAPNNVAAIVVCPGPVETEYLDRETRIRHASLTATGSLSKADIIASIALNLIDAEPCIASGAVVNLDGGFAP